MVSADELSNTVCSASTGNAATGVGDGDGEMPRARLRVGVAVAAGLRVDDALTAEPTLKLIATTCAHPRVHTGVRLAGWRGAHVLDRPCGGRGDVWKGSAD
jgi:hypothetical protein